MQSILMQDEGEWKTVGKANSSKKAKGKSHATGTSKGHKKANKEKEKKSGVCNVRLTE